MERMSLDGEWVLRALHGPVPSALWPPLHAGVPATVPGVAQTDLIALGLIPDPLAADNESATSWVGDVEWSYTRTFDWPGDGPGHTDLVCYGLDTVAEVLVNGVHLASTRNQHREYRWDITARLQQGANRIEVRFQPALAYAQERERVLGRRPRSFPHPYNAIRKAAYSFGWDWGPTVITAGIWRSIALETWSGVRISAVRPVQHRLGRVEVHVDLDWEDGAEPATVAASLADTAGSVLAVPGTPNVKIDLTPDGVEWWWPRGHGDQPLYELRVTAGDDTWSANIGIRTTVVRVTADADGTAFELLVNDRPIFVRGANWIPGSPYPSALSQRHYAASIKDSTDAGLNLLRVWGGGIIESEHFYEECDRQGILVWQDMLLACAAYAEDQDLWHEIEQETRGAIERLTPHPSVVLFNGCNENLWGHVDWGWQELLDSMTWGEGYYLRLFPELMAELAPATPYVPGSPYSFADGVHPNAPEHGLSHSWKVWNEVGYPHYADATARFVAEFGFQGPGAWRTLADAIGESEVTERSAGIRHRQKAVDGRRKLTRGLEGHLPTPSTGSDWHWSTQLNQAHAIAFAIGCFRGSVPLNTGYIIWQLNDLWPAMSWSAVDSAGRRKPMWYALRRASQDRIVTVDVASPTPTVRLHNDSDNEWVGRIEIALRTMSGNVVDLEEQLFSVPCRASVTLVPNPASRMTSPRSQYLEVVTTSGERAFGFFAPDMMLELSPSPVRASSLRVEGGYLVDLEATSLAKDITVLADKVAPRAHADEALITLSAGERTRIRITCEEEVDPDAFLAPHVLRSANELVAPRKPQVKPVHDGSRREVKP